MLWLIEGLEQIQFTDVLPFFPKLSGERREKLLRFRHAPSVVQSVLAELLLRYAIREEYGLTELPRIETGEKGKPFFPDRPDIHFNLSHCSKAVACAVDNAALGVDVQELRALRRDGNLTSAPPVYRVLSEKEHAWVEAGEAQEEQDRRFTAVWTCKEAYGKTTGDGILYDLKSTEFLPRQGSWQQYGFVFQHKVLVDAYLTVCASVTLPVRKISPFHILK